MKRLAKAAFYLLAIAVLSYHLPRLYDRIAFERINKTHLFYSPVSKKFIYTESIVHRDPEAASKAEDHHADTVYKDEDGVYYDRLEFERLLPFIYYRNMEVRGYLPLVIDGQTFGEEIIREERQVMELNATDLDGRRPPENLWPLFEVDPGQKALIFPDDRCRFTDDALDFINADYNRIDEGLTKRFTDALQTAGFSFPARHVSGKFTILKLFDDGVYVVDAEGKLFNLMRFHGEPRVERISLPEGVVPRHVQPVENKRYRGLVLDTQGRMHLMLRENDALVALPLEGYDPENMDFKILLNPLHRTAVYSDETTIRAVAMDPDFQPLSRYEHRMSRGIRTWRHELRDVIFPFRLTLDSPETQMVDVRLRPGAYILSLAPLFGLLLFLPYACIRRLKPSSGVFWGVAVLAVFTGVYGIVCASFIEEAGIPS